MALSSPASISGKVKPVPPPKPVSPCHLSVLKQPVSDVKGNGFQSKRRVHDILPSSPMPGIHGLRGRPSKEFEGSGGDVKFSLKSHHSKSASSRSTSPPPKCFPDDGDVVNNNKPRINESFSSFSPSREVALQNVGKTKPPLLPKPTGIALSSRTTPKPPFPRRSHTELITRRNIQSIGTQTFGVGQGMVASSSAKQEKCFNLRSATSGPQNSDKNLTQECCDSPVRPPRSPKSKPFLSSPFDFMVGQQVLSARRKNLSLPQSTRHNPSILNLWGGDSRVHVKPDFQAKSLSLERNTNPLSLENFASADASGSKLPTPPPRRGKKKFFEAEVNVITNLDKPENTSFPVYAAVNYDLKKNRRSVIASDADTKVSASVQESRTISSGNEDESKSCVEPPSKNDSDNRFNIQQDSVVVSHKDVDKRLLGEVSWENDSICSPDKCCSISGHLLVGECKNYSHEVNVLQDSSPKCSLIKGVCDSSTRHLLVESSSLDNSDAVKHADERQEKESFLSDDHKGGSLEKDVSSEVPALIAEDLSFLAEMDHHSDSRIWIQVNTCDTKNEVIDTIERSNKQECDKVDNLKELDTPMNSAESSIKNVSSTSGNDYPCEPSQLHVEHKELQKVVTAQTSSGSDSSLQTVAFSNKMKVAGDDVAVKRSQTSCLPLRNSGHGRNVDPCRRQSWSEGPKDEDKATNYAANGKQKRKMKSNSFWFDEGDLSSGVLGDHSSFEDIPVEGSGETSPVCRRLSALFSSFGKSSRKPKHKEKTGKVDRKYFCDSLKEGEDFKQEENVSREKEPCSPSERADETNVSNLETESAKDSDGRVLMAEVSDLREKLESFGLKESACEFESESHLSEESFDNVASESENEEVIQPEESLDSSLSITQRKEKKAFYIAQELMTSESVFVNVLRLLCVDFRKAVTTGPEEKSEIITEADLSKILNNLPHLLRFNEELLHDLENRINNWSSNKKISDIIVRKGPFLKLYASYFQSFEAQCQFLDECCENNPRFAKAVRDFERSPRCQKLALKHYMLKPIQRVPQYRLLLEDYLAHLEPTSGDYEDTLIALSIVRDVAEHANRSLKQGDAFSKLLQLQSLLKNYVIIKPGRTFLKEGELQKLCRKGMQSRYFILLNDCLLYAVYDRSVQAAGSLKVNYELPLNGMIVKIPVAEDYANEFSIISTTRSFTLSASSAQERSEWVNALLKAIQDYTSRQLSFLQMKLAQDSSKQKESGPVQLGKAAPVWIQDCRVTMCQCCTAEFTVTFRRHHCRACGKVVCGNCSANKAPLQYKNFQTARVCDSCYENLLKDFGENQKSIQEAIQHEICSADFADTAQAFETIKASFKKLAPPAGRKCKKFIPPRLKEVCANDTGSQMSGWLHWRYRKSWKKMWFVLKEQVLYVYKASEDVVALESIPVLGYEVLIPSELETAKDDDEGFVFSLTHKGKHFLEFQADSVHSTKRWIHAMQEATVLK